MKSLLVFGVLAISLVGASESGHAQTPAGQIETAILQQRLMEAGCYQGPIDGQSGAALTQAQKACPDQNPKLRIETGTHLAAILGLSVDRRCTRAVTGSHDKTIRLWSLPDGRLLRTIRPAIGDGDEGKIYAVAMSPDGSWIASGGWDAKYPVDGNHEITLFPLEGTAPRRLSAFPNVIEHLEFSPDGRRLAATLGGDAGLRVIDLDSGKVTELSEGYSSATYGLVFASDGSIYTSSHDGFIRYYDARLQLKLKVKARGQRPISVALSPDGQRLAVGYNTEVRVDLYAARTLDLLRSLDVSGIDSGNLAEVAWTTDGSVHAAGRFNKAFSGKFRTILRSWDQKGNVQQPDRPLLTTSQSIFVMHPCGDGLAYASADGNFGLIGQRGSSQQLSTSSAADMRSKKRDNFQVSADGRQVYFGLGYGATQPVLFDLTKASLSEASPPKDFFSAVTEGLNVDGWENGGDAPTFSGRRMPLENYEASHSLAIRHDRNGFILGTNFWIRGYDAKGAKAPQVAASSTPATVWGVNLTPDDRVLVAALGDGTIRWYRAADLTELLALFVDVRDRRWIAWTPSGYYMASAGGEDLVGWHFNRGWAQEASFYPARQFRDRFSRSDIVQRVLNTLDEGKAVAEADAVRARSQQVPAGQPPSAASGAFAALPPQVIILSPKDGDHFSSDSIDVSFQLRSPLGQPVTQLQWQVDANPARTLKVKLSDGDEDTRTIPLPKQDVTVSLSAAVGSLNSEPARVRLIYQGAKPAQPAKPNLYLLAIGVDDYEKADEFPKTHAKSGIDAMVATWMKQEGKQFGKVIPIPLLDSAKPGETLTVERIREAYERLGEADNNDLVVVYLVGHGFVDATDKFHFMLRRADIGRLLMTSFSSADILGPLFEIRGRKLVLIESCHAASATEQSSGAARYNMDSFMSELRVKVRSTSFVVIGASQAFQLARFEQRWGYRGAFTQALVEALDGKAADADGRIGVLSLFNYLKEQIPSMTSNNQRPSIVPPINDVSDFPLASIR